MMSKSLSRWFDEYYKGVMWGVPKMCSESDVDYNASFEATFPLSSSPEIAA